MDSFGPLFDGPQSEANKRLGMEQAAEHKEPLLAFARKLAVEIALSRESRLCTADDVQWALMERGISPHALGNAAGSLFAGSCWEWTERFVKSERTYAHANPLRVWRYRKAVPA